MRVFGSAGVLLLHFKMLRSRRCQSERKLRRREGSEVANSLNTGEEEEHLESSRTARDIRAWNDIAFL